MNDKKNQLTTKRTQSSQRKTGRLRFCRVSPAHGLLSLAIESPTPRGGGLRELFLVQVLAGRLIYPRLAAVGIGKIISCSGVSWAIESPTPRGSGLQTSDSFAQTGCLAGRLIHPRLAAVGFKQGFIRHTEVLPNLSLCPL